MGVPVYTDLLSPNGNAKALFGGAVTRAELTALAGASGLVQGWIYLITDENRLAVALSATTTTNVPKPSEVGGGGDGAIVGTVTFDFGSTPKQFAEANFTVTGALTSHEVFLTVSTVMPAGVDVDELEMDTLICAGRVSAADTLRISVSAFPGPVTGQRNINYILR